MTAITTVILIKETAMNMEEINNHYVDALAREGIPKDQIQILPLLYNNTKKVIAKTAKAYLDKLIDIIPNTVTRLVIADSPYFKFITGIQKVSTKYGAVVPGAYTGYDKFECVFTPNYKSLFKQPENDKLIQIGIKAIAGTNSTVTINSAVFGFKHGSDREILDSLHKHPVLTADIEGMGLQMTDAIVSIAFAWSKHDGVAIDLSITGVYHLKKFFEQYRGKLIFHGSLFDAKLLIRQLWMKHATDYEGMMEGLHYFRDLDDTMLMAYIAKNATTQVALSLKECALEYVGNYAIDIVDVTKYTKKEVLEYNLIDTLGTFYLWEKYQDTLDSRIWKEIFQPSIYTLLKMMLVGLPTDPDRIKEVHKAFQAKEKVLRAQIADNTLVQEFNLVLRKEACEKANAKLKKLVKTVDQFDDVEFNPGSGPQLSKLLFETLKLPVLDTTPSGAPATGGDILEDLENHTTDQDVLDLLKHVQDLAEVTKIDGTFIKALLREDYFLHGNLKLGGAQSGRLSSNDPNLTNLPAHGPMGKLVKSCIVAPDGWLFAFADFDALEEKAGAILSKDPNRIKVYTDGFDGHSMRAHRYFADQMPDIDPEDVNSVNSIADKYPELRQKSKPPTFALQYLGTWHTLHKRGGFPVKQAHEIEDAFHELYKVTGDFAEANKQFMIKHGYVQCAFGLKLRTPIIAKCILGNSKTPYEAEREARSANNAVTQSWGMLLNRAMNATDPRIEQAGYALDILPINMVHDAGYFLLRNRPDCIKFLNDTLIEEMEWNDDDAIRSTDVPMSAGLEIGKSWATAKKLKNKATLEEITDAIPTFT